MDTVFGWNVYTSDSHHACMDFWCLITLTAVSNITTNETPPSTKRVNAWLKRWLSGANPYSAASAHTVEARHTGDQLNYAVNESYK